MIRRCCPGPALVSRGGAARCRQTPRGRRFGTAIGATPIAEDSFHPFFHEIVAVIPTQDRTSRRR